MPVTNPSGLYTFGAVKINNQPTINLYAQLMAKQQAKQDALDQYYSKALTDVTPTGMRNKDVTEGWAKKVNDWQEFGMNPENRKYLVNPRQDNYKTLTRFNQMHQDLLNDAQKSKEKFAGEKQWYELNKSARFNPTEEDMKLHDRYSRSIYDPSRLDEMGGEPDLANLSYNAPDLTGQQLIQVDKSIESGYKRGKHAIGEGVSNKLTGKIDTQYQDAFTPSEIKNMADKKADLVNSNKSLQKFYSNMLNSGDEEHLDLLNNAYQSVYGKTIKGKDGTFNVPDQMDTPEKVAKAETILLKSQPTNVRTESVPDLALSQQRKINIEYLKNRLITGRMQLHGTGNVNYNAGDFVMPDGSFDLSKPLQGIKIGLTPKGSALGSDNTKYNPVAKTITYHDPIDDSEKTSPISNFRTNIQTINTIQDLKTFDKVISDIDEAIKKPTIKVAPKAVKHTKGGAPVF